MCVLIFSTNLSETFLILRRTERDTMKNVYWPSCKIPIKLVRFEWNWIFFGLIFERYSKNFMKISPVGAELFNVDRRTDTHNEANSRFLQFCERA
jgi:hypothetical protein